MDVARAELAKATDRDALIRCYFEHAKTLFQFAVLFVVRGEEAQGLFIEGLGAPSGLVKSLTVSLRERNVLARAAEVTRPFSVHGPGTEGDSMLFGMLGRVITNGVAAPLLVRDRAVAVFLGDLPVDALGPRAREAGREPVDLAREEMLLWSNAVGEAFERLIRTKKKAPGSVPPPGLPGISAPPLTIPQAPPLPTYVAPPATERIEVSPYTPADPLAPAPRARTGLYVGVVAALLALGAVGGWLVYSTSGARKPSARVLPGWPKVDPAAAIPHVKGTGSLAAIRAEVDASGKVDFAHDTASRLLGYTYVEESAETEVSVAADGIETQRTPTRRRCGAVPCVAPVAPPTCTFAKVFESAKAAGLDQERAWITYADRFAACAPPGPSWTVVAADRTELVVNPTSCQAEPDDAFVPPAQPIADLGDKQRLVPLDLLARAKQQSGLASDAVLVEIVARGVRDRGVVDMTKPDAGVEYLFADAASRVQRRARRVRLEACGLARATAVRDLKNPTAAPTPKCSFDDARAYATPRATDAIARVRYKARGEDGMWVVETTMAGKNVVVEVGDAACASWALGRTP